ncbi:MAG: DUF6512 family protein [Candidatus Aminicenantia bacterium]
MRVYFKAFLYILIFSLLHFGFDWSGWKFLIPFCGVDESVYQHLKMAFWAYTFASVIEYFTAKREKIERGAFLYSRIFSSTMTPWFIIIIWYLVPAIYGKFQTSFLEIIWAIIVSYISGIVAGMTEKTIEKVKFSIPFRIIIFLLYFFSAFLYIRFTYKPPWIDVFSNPKLP